MHVGNALQYFLYAVLLQGAHPIIQRSDQHLGHPRMILDIPFQRIGGDQQFM